MEILRRLDGVLEWLTPPQYRNDLHVQKRVRMFLFSHMFGPIMGAPIPVFLAIADPNPWPHVPLLAISIAAFWLFPIALKLLPNHYTGLALLSVFNLNFAILWGSYHYGGASSPFLMWLLVMPLLAFFYLGSNMNTRIIIFAQIAFGLASFYAAFLLENAFPVHIPVQDMVEIGVISACCAATYVFFMASYYSRAVDSQSELLKEIERHQDTMKMLRASKEEAERANGAKSEFLAKMSHELRTPLNAVLGYSEILLENAELEERGEDIADLQKISAAGKHLLAMVNDILDISKIEAGKMELNVEPIDLPELIGEIEATGRPLTAKNTNAFIVERAPDLGIINADATKLRQTIFNLLGNAAKFTQNGEITLSARRERRGGADWVAIAVRDTGAGIAHEQQANLFSNFAQANPAISAKYGGTGLGLSLSQTLCRLMGGWISVESELGKGSCFTVHLPAGTEANAGSAKAETHADAAAETRARKTGAAGLSTGKDTERKKILIVDDDVVFLELAERMLIKEGFSPVCTDAPESVLQIARTVMPTAILIDIQMPGLNGWDVLDTLRSDPVTTSIPVFMLSIYEERHKARENGASGLISKPLDINKLKSAMRAAKEQDAGPASTHATG